MDSLSKVLYPHFVGAIPERFVLGWLFTVLQSPCQTGLIQVSIFQSIGLVLHFDELLIFYLTFQAGTKCIYVSSLEIEMISWLACWYCPFLAGLQVEYV